MTRILIADDHEVVRSGLRAILEAHDGWQVVAEAADGKDAIAKARETRPNVAILDYSIPLVNGVEATRQMRKCDPKIEVLIFSMQDSETLIDAALAVGARGYLPKSGPNHLLISAVEALAAHKPFFYGHVWERLLETFHSARKAQVRKALSPRERRVTQLIAEGQSTKQIGATLNLSVKTIESHRAAVRRKLNVKSTADIVRYAIRNKLVEA
jgi:DNA-binding NarL/FixJ family response regulator